MANVQKVATGTEAVNDVLNGLISKCLGYPQPGAYVGGGPTTAVRPPTWDGQGATPWGWTKQPTAVWVASALSAAVPVTDALAGQIASGPAQALLSGAEQAIVNAAMAARTNIDLEAGNFSPKVSAAVQAAIEAEEEKP